jgi:hypothetical protein
MCSHLLSLEQANKIQYYETINVFKSDVVVGSTFVLFIDGNPMVTSFASRKSTILLSLFKVFLFPQIPFYHKLMYYYEHDTPSPYFQFPYVMKHAYWLIDKEGR